MDRAERARGPCSGGLLVVGKGDEVGNEEDMGDEGWTGCCRGQWLVCRLEKMRGGAE